MWGVLLLTASCTSHYQLTNISRSRIVVDSRYDRQPDSQAAAFLAPFKQQVDSIMGPVVGIAAHDMWATRPESDLSNLLADILMWAAKDYNEQPVFSVYNMGGIRAALSKGKVTYGDVLDVAPFENKICFLTMKGDKVLELFQQIAAHGGEGVSRGVELVITKDYKLASLRLNGEEIDPAKSYRITTIDYLAQGNDQLDAFKSGTDLNSPKEDKNNTRFIIMDYFRAMHAKGLPVDAKVEGRVRIEK
jgi:2',3'-cyclic-nucleotide 2'-phosphodiesterase (5'-nucleotidase family)